jgi:hypothetical protein
MTTLTYPADRGLVAARVVVPTIYTPSDLSRRVREYNPKTDLGALVRDILAGGRLPRDLALELLDAIQRSSVMQSALYGILWRAPQNADLAVDPRAIDVFTFKNGGRREILGLLSKKVVTDAGVNYLETAFLNTVEPETLKYHGLGTGTTAEAASQTALVTELTTQYNPDNTRATGTTTTGGSSNIYRTVGTNTVDASAAVTEHAIFSASSAGTMWDRSLFSVINLANSDSLTTTYDLTIASGG